MATERAREYIHHGKAAATVRAYRSDWRHFEAWCVPRGLAALPAAPETVALYLAEHGGALKPATLQRRLAAIAKAHQAAGHESPASMRHAVLSELWKGLKRAHGVAQAAKAPILTRDLRVMLRQLPHGLPGFRDRALLLVGFAGAFRRSELVALRREDCAFTDEGLVVTLRRSKTDQEGEGRKLGIPYGSNPETCQINSWTMTSSHSSRFHLLQLKTSCASAESVPAFVKNHFARQLCLTAVCAEGDIGCVEHERTVVPLAKKSPEPDPPFRVPIQQHSANWLKQPTSADANRHADGRLRQRGLHPTVHKRGCLCV